MDVYRIRQGTRVVYVGAGEAHGTVHTVVEVEPEAITTWSDPVRGRNAYARAPGVEWNGPAAGYSWAGPIPEFLDNFRPIKTQP